MKIRAVIFDLYKTLLEVGPPPGDAEENWLDLFERTFRTSSPLSLSEFGWHCEIVINRQHAAARACGIAFPEVFWPEVVGNVLPEIAELPAARRDEFLAAQVRLWHPVRLASGAASVLRRLARARLPLGIVSNGQPYTLRELDEALASVRLRRSLFQPSLCFLSFEHGFSKPDPHVFRLLAARLAARDIAPEEALVVGDRPDNDIEPARAQDFQTWLLTPGGGKAKNEGGWPQLDAALRDLR